MRGLNEIFNLFLKKNRHKKSLRNQEAIGLKFLY